MASIVVHFHWLILRAIIESCYAAGYDNRAIWD